jgi:hypothetical protein
VDGVAGRSRWRFSLTVVGLALLVGGLGAVVWHLWTGESWTEACQFGAVLAPCWAGFVWATRVAERRRTGR